MDDFYDLPVRDDVMKEGKQIAGWHFAQTDADTRVYYDVHESGGMPRSGFDFCCVEWVGDDGGEGKIPINGGIESATCRVRKLFEGVAYFDGIRHLYFIGDGDGYVYYADLKQIMAALGALRTLELEHCWDCRQPGGSNPK